MIFWIVYSAWPQEAVFANPPAEFAQEFEAIRQEIIDFRGKLISPAAPKDHLFWWFQTFCDDLNKVLVKRALDPQKYDDPVSEHNINLGVSLVRWVLYEDKIAENQTLRVNIAYKSKNVQELMRTIRDYADF